MCLGWGRSKFEVTVVVYTLYLFGDPSTESWHMRQKHLKVVGQMVCLIGEAIFFSTGNWLRILLCVLLA